MSIVDLCNQQDADRLFLFDEESGTTAIDAMGTANGTYVGGVAINQTGPNGQKAVTFSDPGHRVNLGTDFEWNATQGMTIAFWMKSATTGSRIDPWGSQSSGNGKELNFVVNHNFSTGSPGYLGVRLRNGTNYSGCLLSSDSGLTDGEWHHVAIVFAVNIGRMFIDGVFVSTTSSSSGNVESFTTLSSDMYLGECSMDNSPLGNEFPGSLSDFAIFPWRLSPDAIAALASVSPDRLVANPTPNSPYISQRLAGYNLSRHAVDIVGGRRIGVGFTTSTTENGRSITIRHGSESDTKVVKSSALANLASTTFENGIVADLASGNQTVAAEVATPLGTIFSFIVRVADADSGTVIEAGSATHCHPQAVRVGDLITCVGAELCNGDRWAWQSDGTSRKIFDPIAADAEERYHNGVAVVSVDGNLVFLQVGHNRNVLAIAHCDGTDLSTLSSATNLGVSGDAFSYCMAAVKQDGSIVLLTRDTRGVDHLVVATISDPLGSPSVTLDRIVNNAQYYPRSVHLLGDDVCIAFQHRQAAGSGPNRGFYACRYVNSESRWYSLDGTNFSATDLGTTSVPRFADIADLEIFPDPTAGIVQKYIGESCAFWDAGSNRTHMVATYALTQTDDLFTYADTVQTLLGYDGTTGTLTETTIPGVAVGNSLRQSGIVQADGDNAFVAVTDRGDYLPVNTDDEDGLYYNGWGGRTIREYSVTTPWGTPSFTAGRTRSTNGDVMGWMGPLGNGNPGEYTYQDLYEGLNATRAQGVLRVSQLTEAGPNLADMNRLLRSRRLSSESDTEAAYNKLRRSLLNQD